ncbi:MAG: peptidase M50, partial [Gammaproteobacteria bacterium]|nr:peptidase M50 [Gammaproteobacteria bacterium]
MSTSPLSPYWYRVATLRPALRPHIEIHPHRYRDVDWYLMSDPLSGRHHRFTPAAYQLIGLFDGRRTVDQIWEQVSDQLGDDAPTQQETIQLLTRLHAADALHSNITPDAAELFERGQQHRRAQRLRQFGNPLAMRFPLLDPERFLERTAGLTDFVFTRWFAALWMTGLLAAAVVAAQHWTDLTADLAGRVLAPANLVLLWVLYPLVKLAHELGHAYATRRFGGEVHEIGIMMLVLMPVPYVDASSATAFVDKRHRMLVAAAGILVELALAALALVVWLNVEPGIVRDAAFDVMLIGGVSTLLFNGNPLLKFDGYYVLADAIEMPNLATRANGYIGYLVERYLFAVPDSISPAAEFSERAWLVAYGVAAFLYRMVISFTIALFVAGKFFFIGVLLALWSMAMMLVWPLAKRLRYLAASPKLARRRPRALAITGLAVVLVAGLVGFVPVPSRTVAQGVVWLPPDARVRAAAPAFIEEVLAAHRQAVGAGDALIASADPLLAAEVER